MTRLNAIANARATFDNGNFEADLAKLIAFPTESQNPDRAPALRTYLDGAMRTELERLGFTCHLLANPVGGPPFLFAERLEDPQYVTVLGYGHADVVRGFDQQWQNGGSPWTLTRVGDRLYGRGTADNKGQLAVNMTALDAVLNARGGRLGWNVKILVEAGEEIGSPGLHELCEAYGPMLASDVFVASDGPRLDPAEPTIFLGSRGALNFQLRVEARPDAHHSGNWGGLLANPAIVLAHAIGCLVSATGRIEVPALRPAVFPDDVRDALSFCAVSGGAGAPAIDEWWGEPGLSAAEKVYGWNSFEVLAFTAGTPATPVNAIPGNAVAHCQLRFVVDTDVNSILPAIRDALNAKGFQGVEVISSSDRPFIPTRVAMDDPWVSFAAASIHDTLGRPVILLPNLGGSLPNDAFSQILGLPTIWIPHSYANCNQHAPNEHLLASIVLEGLAIMAGLYWDFGNEARLPLTRKE